MAKISSDDGKLPKRIDEFVIYMLGEDKIIRKKSGFTSKGVLTLDKFKLTRMNASEFGQVSTLCKAVRLALIGVLPKRNNLAVVNSLTKKMRQIMTLDTISVRGERNLATAFENDVARAAMVGYAFNPDGVFGLTCICSDNNVVVDSGLVVFPKKGATIGFRCHVLGFDFNTIGSELVSTDWSFFGKKGLPKEVVMEKPKLVAAFGVVFTVVEVVFYEFVDGCYLPLDDVGKVVVVVDC